MKLRSHPLAEEETRDAFDYYENERSGLGSEFTAMLDNALSEIESTPLAWRMIGHGCRKRLLEQFPYAVVYLVEADQIVVYAVMHLRRKPDYWVSRLGT